MDSEKSPLQDILLVEDDPLDVELTLSALEENRFGNTVVVVSDGEEALDYLYLREKFALRGQGNPLMVFLDHHLPKITGLEVLKIMKSDVNLKSIPVVALTSSREPRDLTDFYHYGVNAYVVKPVNFANLTEIIKQLGFFWLATDESSPISYGYQAQMPQKAVRRRKMAKNTSAMEPTFFLLLFSKSVEGRNEYFRVYIELKDEDKALLGGVLSDPLKTRLLVERVGILDLLPNRLNDDWPDFGSVIELNIDDFWDMGIKPTIVKGRNIWIIQGG
jgi:CheY-like chemotaxis protein